MFSVPRKLGEGCWGLHWIRGAQEVSPNPATEPLTRAELGPCCPPGIHVLCFFHVQRPGWAPAKPSLTGEGQARAVPGSVEALGQEQQSRSQESWGIKPQACGDSGVRLLPQPGVEGQDDFTAAKGCETKGLTPATHPGAWEHCTPWAGSIEDHIQGDKVACPL